MSLSRASVGNQYIDPGSVLKKKTKKKVNVFVWFWLLCKTFDSITASSICFDTIPQDLVNRKIDNSLIIKRVGTYVWYYSHKY